MKGIERIWGLAVLAAAGLAAAQPAMAQQKPPYWASITANKARMRTGPGRNFPASWLYQRAGLPVKVIATFPNWRKIEDPDGTQGWMQANLLSDERTAMVRGGVQPMRVSADPSSKVNWRAEPGVIGKLSDCDKGWCRIDVNGRAGFVESRYLWGVNPGE